MSLQMARVVSTTAAQQLVVWFFVSLRVAMGVEGGDPVRVYSGQKTLSPSVTRIADMLVARSIQKCFEKQKPQCCFFSQTETCSSVGVVVSPVKT